MTCVVSLASGGPGVAAPGWFSWLAGATDVLAVRRQTNPDQ